MYRTDPREDADRVSQVLAGTAFPAAKWQLIMQAEAYGADATTRAELWALPAGTYADLRSVLDGIAAGSLPERASQPFHPRPARPRLVPPVPGRVRPLR